MMGKQFATVITLIVAGELFAKGLIATGTIDYLIEGTKHLGLPAYAIMIVVAFISISSVVMGSGNAPFFAFAPLVPDFAQQFGVSTILLLMPMQLSTGLARVMSPIAAVAITAVVVAVARCSGINPFALVGASDVEFQFPSGMPLRLRPSNVRPPYAFRPMRFLCHPAFGRCSGAPHYACDRSRYDLGFGLGAPHGKRPRTPPRCYDFAAKRLFRKRKGAP